MLERTRAVLTTVSVAMKPAALSLSSVCSPLPDFLILFVSFLVRILLLKFLFLNVKIVS